MFSGSMKSLCTYRRRHLCSLLLGTHVTMGRVSLVGLKALPSDLAWMVMKFIVTATNRRQITLCVSV